MTAVVPHAAAADDEELPAWSLPKLAAKRIAIDNPLPERVDREWALGGATGKGVKVCILDSGVEFGHPLVGPLAGAVSISLDEDGDPVATEDTEGDLCGHGTACAGVIRSIAPEAEIYSVRVLGAGFTGTGPVLLAGPALGGRPGLRRRQHEPLDDEAAVRRGPARARRHRVLPRHDPRRLRAQHAGRVVPVAVLVGALRRQPRGGRSASSTTRTPTRRSSSSRAASTSTSRGSAAARSARPATASRRRASRGSPRSC